MPLNHGQVRCSGGLHGAHIQGKMQPHRVAHRPTPELQPPGACILLTTNGEPDHVVGSELTQTEAGVSHTAKAGTVTMVLVGNAAGGNVRGGQTREREE